MKFCAAVKCDCVARPYAKNAADWRYDAGRLETTPKYSLRNANLWLCKLIVYSKG